MVVIENQIGFVDKLLHVTTILHLFLTKILTRTPNNPHVGHHIEALNEVPELLMERTISSRRRLTTRVTNLLSGNPTPCIPLLVLLMILMPMALFFCSFVVDGCVLPEMHRCSNA